MSKRGKTPFEAAVVGQLLGGLSISDVVKSFTGSDGEASDLRSQSLVSGRLRPPTGIGHAYSRCPWDFYKSKHFE